MEHKSTEHAPDVVAPDGSEITLLSTTLASGSMVLCTLHSGSVTRPIRHRTVEEMWHVVDGHGRLWRSMDGNASTIRLAPGVTATIPLGTSFQFRCESERPLKIVIATMPPWPGDDEAIPVDGPWKSTV